MSLVSIIQFPSMLFSCVHYIHWDSLEGLFVSASDSLALSILLSVSLILTLACLLSCFLILSSKNYFSHLGHFLCVYLYVCVQGVLRLVSQSCPTLCSPMHCSMPGSSVHATFQARISERVAISYSRASSRLRNPTCVSLHFLCWQADSLPLHHLGRCLKQFYSPSFLTYAFSVWCISFSFHH